MNEMPMPMPLNLDQNSIETKSHILFWEDIPDRFEPITADAQDENGQKQEIDLYERIPGGTLWKLYLGNFDSAFSENFKLYNKLREASPEDEIEIHISSDGGYIQEIQEFYNIIVPKFKRVATFLNRGYSAGSVAFLLGQERIVYEHSDFMVHSYQGGSYGKRDDMLKQIHHSDKAITKFFDKVYGEYFSKKELKKVNRGDDFWMDSEEMLKRGIATGLITDSGDYITREEYLKENKLKSKKKGKK